MTDVTLRCTAPNVGVNVVSPTHDMKLLDEFGNSVGLIYCDRYGRRNPIGVTTGNMPRSPIRISTGSTGYSDQEPPFITEVQSTWVGGRAQADLSNDRTRFADSFRLDTTKQFPICAPAVIAQQGTGSANGAQYITGSAGTADIANTPVACKFPAIANAKTVSGFTLRFNPGLGVSSFIVYYEAVVSVNAPTYGSYDSPEDYTYSYNVTTPYLSDHYLSIEPIAVPANSNLWLMIYATYPDATTEWILVSTKHDVTGAAVYKKASGSEAWDTPLDKYVFYGWVAYVEEYDSLFFEYRKQMYVIMSTLGKDKSRLYMNGYRGYCRSNSADLNNTNIDAPGLLLNELAGTIIYLIDGPGSQERRPWRKVVSNTALGVCVMDKPWKIAHTVDTEYVVLGMNKWIHIPAVISDETGIIDLFTSAVKTVTVVGDYVIFGFGTSRTLVYFKVTKTDFGATHYIKNDFATDAQYADVLQTIVDKYGITKVWRARGAKVDSAIAVDWASPYTTAPTLVFDINYEQREDLYLKRDRLYVDLYKDMVARNKSLADLDRQKNDLITEITQIIGAAPATIGTPGTYTYYNGTQNVTVDSYLKVANANYLYAQDDIKSLKYEFDDLTTEHNRLLVEHARLTGANKPVSDAETLIRKYTDLTIEHNRILTDYDRLTGDNSPLTNYETLVREYDDLTLEHIRLLEDFDDSADPAVIELATEALLDNFISRKRLAGSATAVEDWVVANRATVTFGNAGSLSNTEYFGTHTALTGSDIAIAKAQLVTYNETTSLLARRDNDIYLEKKRLAGVGTGSWSITNRTYTFANGCPHNEALGTYTPNAGSDIAIAQSYNEAVTKLIQRDEDIYTEKTRIAGSTGTYSFSNQTAVTYTANAIAHSTKIGSSTGKSGSDLYESTAEYANANTDIRELIDRASAIIGSGTIAAPGTDSELKRITDDITYETARLTYESGVHNSIYREILDLTYQISDASNTDAENTATDALSNLAAHVDRSNWVNAKYLPTYVYAGDKVNPVTNIIGYGEPKIPYILKSNGFGSISDGVYQELPIGEMKTINSILNGTAAMQFGVYLYFNLEGGMIERYYDQRLDDVGPNRDEGLPADRQGEITKLLPYPGRYYAAIDAGNAGYSSVLCNNMLGEYSWHEIWRSSTLGDQIYDMYVQTIPGFDEVDRLWIATTGSIIAVPIAITPVNQYKYRYFGYGASSPAYTYDFTTAGWVETSWIDFDVKSIDKYFHSVTIFSDYTGEVKTGDEYKISVYFKVDGDVDWTHVGDVKASEYVNGKFDVGVKELDLRTKNGLSVSGKKIKFRIKMMPCADINETPRLKAIVVNAILRLPSKRSWNVNFLIDPEVDLNDKPIHDKTGLLYYWLNKWANSKTYPIPLTMYTNDYSSDNLRVMIDPTSLVTYDVVTDQSASKNKTLKHIGSLTLYEV